MLFRSSEAVAIGVIAVFALDLFQVSITPGLLFQIVYLGLLLSIGAAGVKGAGIVMSTVLLETLGLPLSLIPILAAIWPIIDIAQFQCLAVLLQLVSKAGRVE